jgi:hypothetical protein
MKHQIQSRAFALGFTFGIIFCGVLNYLTYLNNWCNENIYDCYWYVGFPVPFGIGQGGGYGFDGFFWSGLVTDIFLLFTASVFAGWVFVFVK